MTKERTDLYINGQGIHAITRQYDCAGIELLAKKREVFKDMEEVEKAMPWFFITENIDEARV